MTARALPWAFLAFVLACAAIQIPFARYLKNRPVVEKIGYVPQPEVLNMGSADQKQFLAALLVSKVLTYFGSVTQQAEHKVTIPLDFRGIHRHIEGALKLDPYNMDTYYFSQAIFVWDARNVRLANSMLDYGMKYRTWDWYLPFFAGFNSAYFLKDYRKAADYYRRAGDLSGSDLYQSLAGRYLQASGQTDLALVYLATMEKGARNDAVKKAFGIRLAAFREVKRIEVALANYRRDFGSRPVTVQTLISSGSLAPAPRDPYGGEFYLLPDGTVSTTSKFAFAPKGKKQ